MIFLIIFLLNIGLPLFLSRFLSSSSYLLTHSYSFRSQSSLSILTLPPPYFLCCFDFILCPYPERLHLTNIPFLSASPYIEYTIRPVGPLKELQSERRSSRLFRRRRSTIQLGRNEASSSALLALRCVSLVSLGCLFCNLTLILVLGEISSIVIIVVDVNGSTLRRMMSGRGEMGGVCVLECCPRAYSS